MFNGIRVFSISWVIYGHQYYLEGFNEVNPLSADLVSLRQGVLLTLVYSGLFAVDVFFFIGGFLTSTLVVEKLRKMKNLRWYIRFFIIYQGHNSRFLCSSFDKVMAHLHVLLIRLLVVVTIIRQRTSLEVLCCSNKHMQYNVVDQLPSHR